MIEIRPMANFTGNGVLKGTLVAFDDTGEPLWERVGNWSDGQFLAKAAVSLADDTGISQEKAHKLLKDARIAARKAEIFDAGTPVTTSANTVISARLPGLVDIVSSDAGGGPVYLFVGESGLVTADYYDEDGVRYVPPAAEHLDYLLPREAKVRAAYSGDTTNGLYADLLEWHQMASELRGEHHHLIVLYDFHTYRADDSDYSPMITFMSSEPERGKSRAGKASAYVSYRGLVTETLQEANLFRWSDYLGCTLFIDVRDVWSKAQKRGSDDILLSRFDRHGPRVGRVIDPHAGPFKDMRYFSVYGPTIIAVNEGLREPLTSRCLVIVPPEASGKYSNILPEDGLPLRERLVAWRARTLGTPLPTVPKPVVGRLGDILQPLGQIAHLLGPEMVVHYEALAESLAADRRSERSESTQARLVAAVINAISESQDPDRFSVTAVARHWNEGLQEDKQSANATIGRRVSGLGFQRAGRMGQEQARWRDDNLLNGLAHKFGVAEGAEESDTSDTSDSNGPNQSQNNHQIGLSDEMSDNPSDIDENWSSDTADSVFGHEMSEVSEVSDRSRPSQHTTAQNSIRGPDPWEAEGTDIEELDL